MATTLEEQIKSQHKIIEYLKSQFTKETGRQPNLPISLGALLGDSSITGGLADIDEEEEKKQAATMEGIHQTEKEERTAQRNAF